ncbi:MAG: glycosyltransferase [Pseudomonadota bacterium]
MTNNYSPPRPDVAVFIPSYEGGGAERVALFLSEGLAASGYRTDLVVSKTKGALKDVPLEGPRKVHLNAITEFLALPGYLGYLRRERPRIVVGILHTATLTVGLGRLRFNDVKTVVSLRNALIRNPKDMWWFRRWFGFGVERFVYHRCDVVKAVSKGLAREVEEIFRFPHGTVPTVYNPVGEIDAGDTNIDPRDEPLFDRPVVLGAGRLVPQKNFPLLIRSFAAAANDTDANLVIIGEGPQRADLLALADSLGVASRVFLPGWRPNPRHYMKRARVFAMSSLFEGFGVVCAEALSTGVAIVSTRCPHGPAEILGEGAYGRLVPNDDQEAMTAALKAELQSVDIGHTERLAERADWLKQFQPDYVVDRYREIIEAQIGPPTHS